MQYSKFDIPIEAFLKGRDSDKRMGKVCKAVIQVPCCYFLPQTLKDPFTEIMEKYLEQQPTSTPKPKGNVGDLKGIVQQSTCTRVCKCVNYTQMEYGRPYVHRLHTCARIIQCTGARLHL